MQVAQSLGGKFTEEDTVIPGEAAELPNAETSRNLRDRRHRMISGLECSSNLVECSPVQISHGSYAEVLLKHFTKRPLRDPGCRGELFNGKVLAVMLID